MLQTKEFKLLTDNISKKRAWIEINHSALAKNVQAIKKILAPQTQLMAVVKADAYGHGVINVAQTVLQNGGQSLAVATLEEGIELRQAGITVPILILGVINTSEEVLAIAQWQLEATLCNPQQALVFSETLKNSQLKLPVHLKVDTGMSRLGIRWEKALEFIQFVQQLASLKIASIYSHLATADEIDTTMLYTQKQRFDTLIKTVKDKGFQPPLLHLANSAGTIKDQSLHYDLVRVGLALYGAYPAPHLQGKINLTPVMQVKAKITQIKTIAPNTGVSYGHTFKSNSPLRIAIVSIGYADGVPRLLSNRMQVLIKGHFAAQIGNITMDQLMIDVTKIADVKVGDIVTLLGKDGNLEITADDWANTIGSISWEIFCGFKHRLPRVSINR